MRREGATGHVVLLLCDVIITGSRQVVVMQQPLQVTDVVNGTPQRFHLYYSQYRYIGRYHLLLGLQHKGATLISLLSRQWLTNIISLQQTFLQAKNKV